MRLAWFGVLVTLVLALDVGELTINGQADSPVRLLVLANSTARSEPLELSLTTRLIVQMEPTSAPLDGAVRVYIFDASGVLAALDDPEQATDAFNWAPPRKGRYRVTVTNTNATAITVSIRVNGNAQARSGALPAAAATVRVWFATNRAPLAGTIPVFGTDPSNETSYGYSDVSIPRDHRMGELEAPSIWRLEFSENPQKHISILKVEHQTVDSFFEQIGDRLRQSQSRQALVFVHGFNESFIDAVKRTAQIAYDLAFDGPAMTFSWPSQGRLSPLDYSKDQRNADVSALALAAFLEHLRAGSGHVTIHVIAHSMGNRVLARALESMAAASTRNARPLQEVVMVAPDIDAALFSQAAGNIATTAQHVTLYASSQDFALKAAQRIAGYPRAGEGGAAVLVVPGIETVDASAVQTSLLGLGHSYYADNTTILSDLFGLIRGRRPAERFGLEKQTIATGVYWRFRPAVR